MRVNTNKHKNGTNDEMKRLQGLKEKGRHIFQSCSKVELNVIFAILVAGVLLLIYLNPSLYLGATVVAVIASLLVWASSKVLSLSSRSQFKYSLAMAITGWAVITAQPSYAFMDGFEAVLTTIIESTGNSVDATVATLIVNVMKIMIFLAIVAFCVGLVLNRQDEERLKNIGMGFVAFVIVIILIETAGNFIFDTALLHPGNYG